VHLDNPFVARNGNCEVITSVFGKNPDDLFVKLSSVAADTRRIFEVRFDLFTDHHMESLAAIIGYMNRRKLRYVFTYRTEDADDALEKYQYAARNSALAVDLDMRLKELANDLQGKTPVILSYHGNGEWDLQEIMKNMIMFQAQSYKLANTYSDIDLFLSDLAAMTSLRDKIENPLSFIPMGTGNSFLRVISASLVSDFTYSMLDNESAPGQKSYDQMISMIGTCNKIMQRKLLQ